MGCELLGFRYEDPGRGFSVSSSGVEGLGFRGLGVLVQDLSLGGEGLRCI